MADLTLGEKRKLESLFEMGSGYVLNFSDRTLRDFVYDSVGLDINNEKYHARGSSKANRMRVFWIIESDHAVGKLIADMIEYEADLRGTKQNKHLAAECRRISDRLNHGKPVAELAALDAVVHAQDFEVLAKEIRGAIDRNQPEAGLDRLHTFVVKYVRTLCGTHGIAVTKEKALHSLFGEYVKVLRDAGRLESEMTARILKSSISVLEAFNDVRNHQSLAHDNAVLNHDESLLIFNHVASSIRFITALERRLEQKAKADPDPFDDTAPF